jgi:hypothetical protein
MDLPPDARVSVLATAQPVAFQPTKFAMGPDPLNLTAGGTSLLIFRSKVNGRLCIFDRAVKGDLFPQFRRKTISNKPDIAFTDADTGSLWTADGKCVDGFAKGEQLKPVKTEDDVAYVTLKSFYPDTELLKPQ